MFFMMGITSGCKELGVNQMMICNRCGKYGRYTVFMTYTVLSLFFIPCFKWNKKYYVKTSCCGTVYQLNKEIGRRIERGETIEITSEDMGPTDGYAISYSQIKRCENCGFSTDEDFEYCPKCGRKF